MPFTTTIQLGNILDFNQAVQDSVQQIEAGDFNGDGRTDFLVMRIKGEGNTPAGPRIMVNLGNGTWQDQTSAMFAGAIPTIEYAPRVVVADLNGDGRSDVYAPNFGPHNNATQGGRDQVWLSRPGGTLALASTGATQGLAHGVTYGDIDRDGDIDVVVNDVTLPSQGPRADRILINNGQGAFTDNQALLPPSLRTGPDKLSHTWSLLADLTGDGAPDLVLGTWEAALAGRSNFSPPSQVLINDGRGSFAASAIHNLPQSPVTPESTVDIDAMDLNGDGLNDLVVSVTRGGDGSTGTYYGTGYIQLLINRGGGQFSDETAARYPAQTANAPGAWWKFVRSIDFNLDGAPDLLLTGAGGGAYAHNQAARVLLNDGTGRFSESVTLPTTGTVAYVSDATTVADVNGDGRPDLVGVQWTSSTGLSLVALLNDYPAPARSTGTAAADRFTGGIGTTTFDAGAGVDTVVYSGARATHTLTRTDAGVTIRHAAGTDTLVNVERVKFSDALVALDTAGNAGMAYRLYQAAFDRTPDQGGLGFQMKALDDGLNIAQVAANFIASPEFQRTYGALNDTQFVTQLYQNVLHRAPDSGGLAFHVNNLATGANTRANVLVGFSESPENQAALIGAIQNGMVYTV